MYYLRTKPAANAIQFTVDKQKVQALMKGGSTTDVSKISKSFTFSEDSFMLSLLMCVLL